MGFRIADTFTDSLGRLTGDEQKAAKTTAFDLQINPAHPGLSFHKLNGRDKNFWSVRVNADIRLIVHRTEGSLLLCYDDHYDKAYAWAERRKLRKPDPVGNSFGRGRVVACRRPRPRTGLRPLAPAPDVPNPAFASERPTRKYFRASRDIRAIAFSDFYHPPRAGIRIPDVKTHRQTRVQCGKFFLGLLQLPNVSRRAECVT